MRTQLLAMTLLVQGCAAVTPNYYGLRDPANSAAPEPAPPKTECEGKFQWVIATTAGAAGASFVSGAGGLGTVAVPDTIEDSQNVRFYLGLGTVAFGALGAGLAVAAPLLTKDWADKCTVEKKGAE